MPVGGSEGGDGGTLHFTDAEQEVELGQRELVQRQTQNSLSLLCSNETKVNLKIAGYFIFLKPS